MSLRLPLDQFEPTPEAAEISPDCAQLQLWLARAQRDSGLITDKKMANIEAVAVTPARKSRLLWNPYTGEFRNAEIDAHYRSGDYLRHDISSDSFSSLKG